MKCFDFSNFNARDYLGNIEKLSSRIKAKSEQLKELNEMYNAIGCNNADAIHSQTNNIKDNVSRHVIKKIELIKDIEKDIYKYTLQKNNIINDIYKLKEKKYIDVLTKRYVEFKSLEKIAVELNYNYDYIRQLHKKALTEFKLSMIEFYKREDVNEYESV